VYNRILLQKEV